MKDIGSYTSKRKFRAFVYSSLLIFLLGFRHPSMGVDLPVYLTSFHTLSNYSISELLANIPNIRFEKGFVIFNYVIGKICESEQFFLFSCAVLSIAPIGYVFYKKSENLEISFIIYLGLQCFLICFSGLRQGIAVGLCYLSSLYIPLKKIKMFIFLNILAISFHSSAKLFFIAYLLYRITLSVKGRFISVIALLIVFIFKAPLFLVLSKILKDNSHIQDTGSLTLFVFFALIYIFCFLQRKIDNQYNFYLNLFWIACFCQAFSGVFQTAIRAGYYFMIFLPLLLPKTINSMENRSLKAVVAFIVVVSFALFGMNSLYIGSWTKSYPYLFFWELSH